MKWYWWIFGLIEVCGFFYFSNILIIKWHNLSSRNFEKSLIKLSLTLRIFAALFLYVFFDIMTGQPFMFAAADSMTYHLCAERASIALQHGDYNLFELIPRYMGDSLNMSDFGYPAYLTIIYAITFQSVILARILKAIWSTWTVVLIYKVAVRNFGESTGRMAAIFAMLMPHFIYYCGLHLKEVEMVFLSVAFIERADFMLRSNKLNIVKVFLPLLLVGLLFTFRTVLGIVALFSLLTALVFSSKRILGFGKRFFIGIWIVLAIFVFLGGSIATEVEEVWQKSGRDAQTQNMEWRSQREGGNQFAKYAGATIFAPLIFTIPFPTMVHVDYQENQMMVNGNNYVKNILSFFVIFAFYLIIKRKLWSKFPLLIAYILMYLGILAFSPFAQSERFHLPALPIALIFAAYGISEMTTKHKKVFNYWTVFILIAIIGWSWFKLAGRGLV